MEQEKLTVVIDNENRFIEISDEESGTTLHIDGTTPNPQFLGKAIGNYLLNIQKIKEDKAKETSNSVIEEKEN